MSRIFTLPWLLLLCSIHCATLVSSNDSSDAERKAYIVYMGERPKGLSFPDSSHHTHMLNSVLGRDASKSLLRSYKSFNGFVVQLTKEEMQRVAAMKGVVSVFASEKKFLHTTRSWDFMGFSQRTNRSTTESDVIVGVLDSGIWPESDSFSDKGFGPPPTKWKGICQTSSNFTCNNKLIGARYYRSAGTFPEKDVPSPRDTDGHGTHCASTAAGGLVSTANFMGFGTGTARGGVPSARIAAYKICWSDGCDDADILAAFDDAISDGVDIISLSVGGRGAKDYFNDSIAIGSFHAMRSGILTVTSGGNSGPSLSTISNVAPWFVSVAASTIDRTFSTAVQLGNNMVYKGVTVNTFDMNNTMYPLIYAGDAPNSAGGFTGSTSRFCEENSLDPTLVSRRIVLCDALNTGKSSFLAGAAGVVMQDAGPKDSARTLPLPASYLDTTDGGSVYSYYLLSSNPTATIFKSDEVNDTLAPYVSSFSSRGPNSITLDLLKPDLTAPGVHILAAWSPVAPVSGVEGDKRVVQFNFLSGTSMSCPHVSGVAAYIKSFYPLWSPAAIKSALMTTALPMNRNTSPEVEFAYGAGHLNPLKVLDPGLVYDADVSDYVKFLCGQGYSTAMLQQVTGDNSTCTQAANASARDLNVPSFALAVVLLQSFTATYSRTVTNVGPSASSTYTAKILAPSVLSIQIVPSVLNFTSVGQKLSFEMTIQGTLGLNIVASASLTWDDGLHQVRSPIVVYAVS